MSASDWLTQARRPIASVVEVFGWRGRRSHYPCPARCSSDDFPVYSRGDGWRCFRCDARGDSVDFVGYALHGARFRDLTPAQRDDVKAWHGAAAPIERVVVPAPPPVYADTFDFWSACTPVGPHPFAVARGFANCPPSLARLTPLDTRAYPEWWPASWAQVWRLVTRGWTPDGQPVNLHARAVCEPPVGNNGRRIKTRWAQGLSASGLVFWNEVPPSRARLTVIAEGITDWLTLAIWATNRPVAVYGATSGGFSAFDHIDIPKGADLIVAVDEDEAGDAYLARILQSYEHRPVHRLRPSRFAEALSAQAAK